jgi:hypothetical protein
MNIFTTGRVATRLRRLQASAFFYRFVLFAPMISRIRKKSQQMQDPRSIPGKDARGFSFLSLFPKSA